MPLYKYKAADASGKIAQGSLQAESLSGLKAALKNQGLFLMKGHRRVFPLKNPTKAFYPGQKKERWKEAFRWT